jgi:predicted RNA-binding Zn-ribbon protein involved in translation (DUF1610 family)
MIECRETQSEFPVCPHCGQPVREVLCRRLSSVFGKRYIYFCALCKKVLGVSHRKGFWMG